MSLFVKGAKLPKIEGDKSIKAEIRCVGGKWEFGIMTGGYYCCQQWSFYPLSELPPHGRLIDADDAIETAWMILRGLGYFKEENPQLEQTVREVFATAPAIEVE